MSVPVDFLPSLPEELHNALTLYNKGDKAGNPLHYLRGYRQIQESGVQGVRAIHNRLLQTGVELLSRSQADYATILQRRFFDEKSATEVARQFTFAEGTIFKKQREGIEALAQIIRQQEWLLHTAALAQCYARLESTSQGRLFGIDDARVHLTQLLLQPTAPWLIAIEGIGGIGKTTLADTLVRQMLNRGEIGYGALVDVGWVTARQSVLNGGGAIKAVLTPALTSEALLDRLLLQLSEVGQHNAGLSVAQKQAILTQRLKIKPHLIVIDNLETVVDVEHLLATIRLLANPSKFLLTTRQNLYFEADLAHVALNELTPPETFALIRYEAGIRNLPDLERATDADLHAIYGTVGGNPLAVRLLLGQLHSFSLDQVLDDLRHARGQKAEDLYTYVYRHIWQRLADVTQRILLLMPLAAERGADLAFLTAMAAADGIAQSTLRDGLDRLVALNLVESRGDLHQRRYAIHSLTRSFLQQDVLRWGQLTNEP